MKKNLLMVAALAAVFAVGSVAMARITGASATDADIWCVGPDGAEVCVDSSGNFLPTTASDTDLGSSALPWANVYADTLGGSFGLDTSKITSGVFNSSYIPATLDTAKILSGTFNSSFIPATLDTSKIASGSFGASRITAASIDTTKLNPIVTPATGTLLCFTGDGLIGKVTAIVDTGITGTCAAF